jgi:hypothetical protein
MEVRAKDKLKAALESEAACQKQYGRDMMRKIMLRVGELRAAESLVEFVPIEENAPKDRSNERKRWASITKIEIVAIEDTHGQ